jgi:hypothetical protein
MIVNYAYQNYFFLKINVLKNVQSTLKQIKVNANFIQIWNTHNSEYTSFFLYSYSFCMQAKSFSFLKICVIKKIKSNQLAIRLKIKKVKFRKSLVI